jgi:glycosyltransferase involved in cell wall biosynthesis
MHRVEQAVARGATLNLGASNDLVRQALECGGRAELGMVAAPQPAKPERSREEVRTAIGVGDEPMILAVGRLHPQKDYPTMLQAMAYLQDRVPSPTLVIAGDGPDADRIADLAGSIAVRTRLLGRRNDIADLMAAADVLAVSSTWEARALVVQEAMMIGLPVVATYVGGIPELVGSEAVVVPSHDSRALAEGIGSVLDDREGTDKRVERARRLAATWPDEAGAVERVLSAYRDVGVTRSETPRQPR